MVRADILVRPGQTGMSAPTKRCHGQGRQDIARGRACQSELGLSRCRGVASVRATSHRWAAQTSPRRARSTRRTAMVQLQACYRGSPQVTLECGGLTPLSRILWVPSALRASAKRSQATALHKTAVPTKLHRAEQPTRPTNRHLKVRYSAVSNARTRSMNGRSNRSPISGEMRSTGSPSRISIPGCGALK